MSGCRISVGHLAHTTNICDALVASEAAEISCTGSAASSESSTALCSWHSEPADFEAASELPLSESASSTCPRPSQPCPRPSSLSLLGSQHSELWIGDARRHGYCCGGLLRRTPCLRPPGGARPGSEPEAHAEEFSWPVWPSAGGAKAGGSGASGDIMLQERCVLQLAICTTSVRSVRAGTRDRVNNHHNGHFPCHQALATVAGHRWWPTISGTPPCTKR